MRGRVHYESDSEAFPADAYAVQGYKGVAFYVLGWEMEPDEDTEWTGMEVRTGKVVAVMVGDDHRFTFDPNEIAPLERSAYCGSCGQIGCGCDAYEEI